MANTLLVVGDDKTGHRLLAALGQPPGLVVLVDRSSSPGRIWRLLRRGSLGLATLAKMAAAEWRRPDFPHPPHPAIASSRDLIAAGRRLEVDKVFLFRAGIIIDRPALASGLDIRNVHCATLAGYGGIGAIARALRDGALDQQATLHRVTARIDQGEILATEPYRLDPALGYRRNEDLAYDAGIRLLLRELADCP